MNDDVTQTQLQDGDDHRRTRNLSAAPSLPAPPGDVPGYQPLRCLGRGAYGEVWLAVHRENPGQQVAIKFYTHRGHDWSLLAREVEKLNFLATGSHVVQVVTVGWTATPPYYVMQYFERGSLGSWLENARLSVPDAVNLFREIVVGLVQAHNRGVLHCDLKPDNILLDQEFKPRLADFGQSRLAGEKTPTLGTLFYMSPEQADLPTGPEPTGLRTPTCGHAEGSAPLRALEGTQSAPHQAAPDARWDVYALGAVLYTMLTGSAPYRTPQAEEFIRTATSLPEQLARYRQVLLTQSKPTAHRRALGIDRRLIDILDRCLSVDPKKRFANAQAVLGALDSRALARARRPLFLVTAVAAALLLIGMALFSSVLFQTAVEDSETTLTQRVLENNLFAAQFGAATAAREIDLRWQVLRDIAEYPRFQELVQGAVSEPTVDGLQHQRLQGQMDERLERLTRTLGMGPSSLFVIDAHGTQMARSPFNGGKTIGSNFAFRDYFHGLGKDLARGDTGAPPIAEPHLSIVYKSEADGKPRITFTVPIWNPRPPAWVRRLGGALATIGLSPLPAPTLLEPPSAGVVAPGGFEPGDRWPWLGVLGMSVQPGHFVELQPAPGSTPTDSGQQVAVLVDSRPDLFDPDTPGQRGLILQHPRLDAYLEQHRTGPAMRFADLDRLDELWQARQSGLEPAPERMLIRGYADPFVDPTDHCWLGALAPVEVKGHRAEATPTRWVVLVQQRYSTAVAPVNDLRWHLWSRGLLILGVLGIALGGLGLFVAWVLNESARSPLHRLLRRRAGLEPVSSGKPTPLLPLTIQASRKTLPGEPGK
jgi:serine/threonine protein kinase